METKPFVTNAGGRDREGWDEPAARGSVQWVTLLSGDATPTDTFSAGIAEFAPRGGDLKPHRHSHSEIYHILEGQGAVMIEGVEHRVKAGDTVFIPGDAEHGVVNDGETVLRFFYAFAADRFSDVVYRFPDDSAQS